MKNRIIFFSLLLCISFLSCSKKNDNYEYVESVEEAVKISEEKKLLSTYSEGPSDLYSWRMRKNTYDENDLVLSKEKLLSTLWGCDQHFYLVFYSDDVFKLGSDQHGPYVTGSYKVEDSSVILYDYNFDSYINETVLKLDSEIVTGTLVTDIDDFLYKHELQFNGGKFFALGCYKKAGDKSKLDGETVILEDSKKYFLTENVSLRSKPNVQATKILNESYSELYKLQTNVVFKYDKISVICRTEKEYTYDGVTGPWLYIKIDLEEGSMYGWIFGGYTEEYFVDKAMEYNQLLKASIEDAGGWAGSDEDGLYFYSGRWSLEIENCELKLKENGTYSLGHPFWDGFFSSGKWSVSYSGLIRVEYPDEIDCSDGAEYKQKVLDYLFPEKKSRDFRFDKNYKTFSFSGCLKSEEIILVEPYKRRSPANEEYELSGVKVIKLENSFIVSSENLKLRKSPAADGEEEKFEYSIFGDSYGLKNILIKNFPVKVDAVTVEKTEIDGIAAPWYRIILSGGEEDYGHTFWVWGGYSEFYNSMEKYYSIMNDNHDLIVNEL